MKKIPLMPLAVIILLSSFLAPIKVTGGRGGRTTGGGVGYSSTMPGGGNGKVVGGGYRGGDPIPKPKPGNGDTGPALVIRPKPPQDDPPKKGAPMPMPQQCKPEVRHCIKTYIYGGVGRPKYRGSCCLKLKHSVKCVCKFLKSQDADLRNGANGVLKGCHYRLRKPCPN